MSVGAERLSILAQAPGDLFGQVLPWLIMLIGVVIVGGAGIYLVRRMLQGGPSALGESFTLHELRQMREEGQLSDEEFEQAKALIIGHVGDRPSSGDAIGPHDDDRDLHV